MAVSESCELRLLRCALRINAAPIDPVRASTDVESSLLQAVDFIEQGLYSRVAAMEVMREIFGDVSYDPSVSGRIFYDKISRNVRSFVEKEANEAASMLVMAAGVSFFCVFLQSNFTGPELDVPAFPLDAISKMEPWIAASEQSWDTWARSELMVDGCDLQGKCNCPQYLVVAKVMFEAIKNIKEPATRVWWIARALFCQQKSLEERSPTLLKDVASGYAAVVKCFGTKFLKDCCGWYSLVSLEEENAIATMAFTEAALVEYYYGHADEGRLFVTQAEKTAGLVYSVEGAMGFRRQYQSDPTAQMVLKDESNLHVLERVDKPAEQGDVLLYPRLESSNIEFLHQKALSPIHQVLILARCLDVKKKNAENELRDWEMAPFIEAVDAQQASPFMVKTCCKLLRVEWEKSRGPTCERAFQTMDDIVSSIRDGSCNPSERMELLFCVSSPCLQALLRQYANTLVSIGNIGEALSLFEKLELWQSVIDCYRLLGDKARGVSLIKERLEISPNDPRLWCSLGDATNDDACFLKSWEVSGQRYAVAQRFLARSAMNRKEYEEAVKHWDLALSLNPLYSDGWFSAGFCALKCKKYDQALHAFVRTIQLDPEHGEAFNNIAALNMRKENLKEASTAFQQAVQFKRNSWELWDNYAHVLVSLGNFAQAIPAVRQVFELSPRNVDTGLLARIIDVFEEKQLFTSETPAEGMTDHERKRLIEMLGELISKMASSGNYGGDVWGVKARWHKVLGDRQASTNAFLRQVRAYQGSNWQHDEARFRAFAAASLGLCQEYIAIGGKKELAAAQRHLTNTLKQADDFKDSEDYKALESMLGSLANSLKIPE
ncbi:tetratricopeptide repeat protein 27 homolog [Selaginella moellendorffii]|uniref:tetratricopeptide repeat protein 27 homolog n=1 Tax=Selaginella moellendorffii TaxID=88036 RepID=UPI000D1C8D48|nr:tetratricopeptide repeat protein 27 homolog [Selaginella moellendorffii]|eukprot:XP_024545311.1 tetratricopeptide repeat protein 27 homolog [Selaginella moellendorffii]